MLKTDSWKPSNVVGLIFMIMGIVPFILWILDYMDVIRPEEDPASIGIVVISVALLSLGLLLRGGKGDSISAAFLAWFQKKSG